MYTYVSSLNQHLLAIQQSLFLDGHSMFVFLNVPRNVDVETVLSLVLNRKKSKFAHTSLSRLNLYILA